MAPMHAAVWSMVTALSYSSKRQGAFTQVNSSPCSQYEAHSDHAACGFEAHRDYLVTVDNQQGLDYLYATPAGLPAAGRNLDRADSPSRSHLHREGARRGPRRSTSYRRSLHHPRSLHHRSRQGRRPHRCDQ